MIETWLRSCMRWPMLSQRTCALLDSLVGLCRWPLLVALSTLASFLACLCDMFVSSKLGLQVTPEWPLCKSQAVTVLLNFPSLSRQAVKKARMPPAKRRARERRRCRAVHPSAHHPPVRKRGRGKGRRTRLWHRRCPAWRRR